MNTGVQRSSATPPAARTATTPALGAQPGNVFGQGKNLPRIAMAHGIPYVATATVADLHDLEAKVEQAMSLHGARYLHVLVPCPLGWGSASHDTIRLARLAQQSGLFPVFEAEHGEVTAVSKIRRRVPVEDYLKPQKRFAHLFAPQRRDDVIAHLQADGRPQHPPVRPARPRHRRPVMTHGQALRDHARRRLLAGQQDRLVALEPAGLRRPPAAVQPAVPGRRGHPGLAVPRRGRRLRARLAPPGARQPVPGHHGPRLLPLLRERLQPRQARCAGRHQRGRALPRRRGAASAAGTSTPPAAETGKHVLVVGAGPSGLVRPTTCAASATASPCSRPARCPAA